MHRRKIHGIIPTEKACTRCHVVKPVGEFKPAGQPNTYDAWCRICKAEKAVEWRKNRPASHVRRDRKKSIARRFGVSVEDYDMVWGYLLDRQGGTCATCADSPVHMDHDHRTGRLRGVMCLKCNLALGYIDDSAERAQRLAIYLTSML
jgi:hypothetical protein